MKTLLARWASGRFETRARSQRRSLRDYQRRELAIICELERRARGLRLYAAWSRRTPVNIVRPASTEWNASLPHAA